MRSGYIVAMVSKLEPISIRLDPEVKSALEAMAQADDRSLSAYVNRILKQHVEDAAKRKPRGKG